MVCADNTGVLTEEPRAWEGIRCVTVIPRAYCYRADAKLSGCGLKELWFTHLPG